VHTNKVFVSKISPFNINLVYSGSWDRSVKFWDVRANAMTAQLNTVQICGDSVDMSQNNQYLVTGGGSLGEGIRLWDMRKLQEPLKQIQWD
jgi:WD40 repeat protein